MTQPHGRARLAALAFAMLFPSLAAWLYFVVYSGKPSTRTIYAITKTVQFAFPVVWLLFASRDRPRLRASGFRFVGSGIALGVLGSLIVGLVYVLALRGTSLMEGTPAVLLEKLQGFGATTPARFALLGAFIAVIHSWLEEYYWRWFVFAELRRDISSTSAVLVSSLAFAAHHVIVIGSYLEWQHLPVIALFSGAVALAGAAWAWLYLRSGSLASPWISHLVVDVALMIIGYDLIWG